MRADKDYHQRKVYGNEKLREVHACIFISQIL